MYVHLNELLQITHKNYVLQGIIVTIPESQNISLHIILRDLINQKSKRDNIEFTAYQLARAIGMPRSLITNLTHHDIDKRVTNPRITTLIRIVDFFKKDGFDISLEYLLGFNKKKIDIQKEQISTKTHSTIPIYSSLNSSDKMLGTIDINLSSDSKDIFAVYAENEVTTFFKEGSIFIIDPNLLPEDGNLIAAEISNSKSIIIRKYHLVNGKVHLKSLDPQEEAIIIMPTMQYKIIGIIIQVNAKT